MTRNRLADATSPYLLQHRDNPVHWWAWGPGALAEAKVTGKPILLSVGYAACHWCHVMAHESFEDPATAALMNTLFVNIKVDREERPDVDALYMRALHMLGQQGGWPLTMFLTPDAEPFYGGTYFPPEERFGRPSFRRVLNEIARIHAEQPQTVRRNADTLLAALRAPPEAASGPARLDPELLADMARRLARAVDPVHGGLTGAPKFPQYSIFWFLWRAGIQLDLPECRDAVLVTLRAICQGGIYDHLAGGFARYSVDERWLVPHFEKMLYDNALLLLLLTEAYRETGEPLFAERIAETIGWLLADMRVPEGGFAASYDADSEGEEGKFCVWTPAEVEAVLGAADGALFCAAYDITAEGNFEGHAIPNRLRAPQGDAAAEAQLARCRTKLLAVRRQRVQPGWDDKVLADWNGLTIRALAEAAGVFARPDWRDAAISAYRFVMDQMRVDGRLQHAWRLGRTSAPSTAADSTHMISAALSLHAATGMAPYLADAIALSDALNQHFRHPAGGYCQAAADTPDLIVRLRTAHDDAVPDANSVMISNLVALSVLDSRPEWLPAAEAVFAAFADDVAQSPGGHTGLLAASFDLLAATQVVIVAPDETRAQPLLKAVNSLSLPGAVVLQFASAAAIPPGSPSFGKAAISGQPTAYVCVGARCSAPLTEPGALRDLLRHERRQLPPSSRE